MDKKSFRKLIIQKRNEMSILEKNSLSNQVIERLVSTKEYNKAKNIFVFVSTEDEIFTHDFIKNSIKFGKSIYIPFVDSGKKLMYASKLESFDDLEIGFYDILSLPESKLDIVNPEKLDLVIVPGLVFGKNFYRIGYGGGYYDKYLSNPNITAVKIGICYEFQVFEKVDYNNYDIPVEIIITEKEEYESRRENE
ncbi:MAG: 5-formyltetrahydrofolate cyclo-ligase [Tissierellia bacterium]|nr:5-formyltetrahydrofolate cyclo-ligase [Tissierellia bacterium]